MRLAHFLSVLPVVILISLTAYAQEETPIIEGPDPAHRELNFSEDKTLLYDQPTIQQAQPSFQQPGTRDTVVVAPKPINRTARPDAPREGQKPRSEDDALSFNFLYYIIQKYKLSDLIEN
ncbi:MAG: hypothetical protein JNN04_06830 [Cyclobacteriaceae bacterium]|nr:hypothetical protein [Cyclobacteriaceae bacterium]